MHKPVVAIDPAPASLGSARVGIAIAVGALAPLDQQVVRTMLQTLGTRLGAYFRVTEAREAELTLVEHPTDPSGFQLRVRNASNVARLSQPRPLRLMPFSDALNATIEIVRPQNAPAPAANAAVDTIVSVLSARTTPAPVRIDGAWGSCVFDPNRGEAAFDRNLFLVARGLADDPRVVRQVVVKAEVAAGLRAASRVRLRRDEVAWLCGSPDEAQRAVAVKLAHPDAFVTLRIWPNLARLPEHPRWLGVFALMQRGAGVAAIVARAAADGLGDVQVRRGLYLLLQNGQASLERRAAVERIAPPVEAPSTSFLQRLRQRLRQMVERA